MLTGTNEASVGGTDSGRTRPAARPVSWLLLALILMVAAFLLADVTPPWDTSTSDDPLSADLRAFADEGPVRVGWLRDAAPVSVWEGDRLAGGYAVEMWNLIAIKLGLQLEHVAFDDNAAVVAALREGSIDIAGAHGQRPDLREFADRTEPLAWERITFVGAPEQAPSGVDTLAGRSVSTIAGTPLVFALQGRYPEAEYVESASIADGLSATARGDIELYLAPLAVAGYTIRQEDLDLVPIGEDVEVVNISGWAPKDSQALALARAGRATLTDEEISLITVRWASFDLGPPRGTTPAWLLQVLAVALAVSVGFGLFVLILRRRVRAATSELTRVNLQLAALNADLEERVAARTSELAAAVDRLNQSNLALTEFAQSVAHDLRGPVTAIFGMSNLLRAIDVDEAQLDQMLGSIESSSARLSAMIEDLLDDAVKAGAHDPDTDGQEFSGWLSEILGPEVHEIGATLEVDVPSGPLPLDAPVLRRVALNLVGNAIKYATNPSGTRVAVRLTPADGETWVLTVEDNGPGIPEPLWAAVFDAGYRRHDDGRGRGLGLADAREAVERAGGSIRAGVADLGGARFTVVLPVRDRSSARAADVDDPRVLSG